MSSKLSIALIALATASCASGSGSAEPSPPEPAATPPAATAPPPAAPAPSPSGSAASFTEVQADRGRDLFRAMCTECHYSSEFSDAQFKFKWSRRSAGNLYELIQTQMPETAPGSLAPEEVVDLVSYILRMNGFRPGGTELPADRAVLDGVSLASIRGQ